MKIHSVTATNFASYKELEFDFASQGLTLIAGPTGAGKSTLCDLIPWVLFGKTAKGGAADEILSWPGDQTATAIVTFADGYEITRTRGKYKDLYITDGKSDTIPQRGKDLLDTQRIINQRIGLDYDLYLASSYYHEFSQTAQFFIAPAKSRRAICEQLVDLSLAKKLQLKASEDLKVASKEALTAQQSITSINSNISLLERLQASENTKAETWSTTHESNKKVAIKQYDQFEANRKKVISKKCNSCGTVLQHPHEVIDDSVNPYLSRLAELEQQTNPYEGAVKDYSMEISAKYKEELIAKEEYNQASLKQEDLELLQQVISDYRSTSIINTIKDVEGKTNQLLTDYFDAEIRVSFSVAEADKLDVEIQKDGNIASYTQLSKGQRCILKLCFGIAVMQAVSNHHAIQPQQLFFDESLDGMDSNMKEKAYRLLETISQGYESIFVVEHSENLKTLFPNSYTVSLTNEGSVIEKI